jgi:hypothetical protein
MHLYEYSYLTARIKIAEENMKAELEEQNKELLRNELAMDGRKRKARIARRLSSNNLVISHGIYYINPWYTN